MGLKRHCLAVVILCGLLTVAAQGAVLDIFGNVLDPRDPVPGTDFSGVSWQFADLRGLDLTGVNFERAHLDDPRFDGAILDGARFDTTHVERGDFSGVSLVGTTFNNSSFLFSAFEGIDFSSSGYLNARGRLEIDSSSFGASNMRHTNFEGLELRAISFTGADLRFSVFDGSEMISVQFGTGRHAETPSDARYASFQDVFWNESSAFDGLFNFAQFQGALGEVRGMFHNPPDLITTTFSGALYDSRTNLGYPTGLPFDYDVLGMVFIPEPTSCLLLLTGALLAGRVSRRRVPSG